MTHNKILFWGLALAAVALPASAEAGNLTTTCTEWRLSAGWGGTAFIIFDTELRHHTSPADYTVAVTSGAWLVHHGGGPFVVENSFDPIPESGNHRAFVRATVFAGLDHYPFGNEINTWPSHLRFTATFDSAQIYCEEPVAEPVVYTGAGRNFYTVPEGCRSLDIKLWGAGGGGYLDASVGAFGGGGGFTSASMDVFPGETLVVLIGSGGAWEGNRARGGGATSLSYPFSQVSEVLAISGGGGGGGSDSGAVGGAGGGDIAGDGSSSPELNGGGGNNLLQQGGLSFDGARNGQMSELDRLSPGPYGDGWYRGGSGASIDRTHVSAGASGGGTGYIRQFYMTTDKPGQGTFTGSAELPAGTADRDYLGQAGHGGITGGVGQDGLAVLRCQ